MEYLAICELASGDFPDCHRDAFPTFEDFKVCVEAKLTLLRCFNYLSEDSQARLTLYNVCRFNKSAHMEGDELTFDDAQFQARFPCYQEFENLFE